MKYASVIVPLVVVGVLFVLGCIWVATRRERDEEEEPDLERQTPPMTKPELALPSPAHTRYAHSDSGAQSDSRYTQSDSRYAPSDSRYTQSDSHTQSGLIEPPRYER